MNWIKRFRLWVAGDLLMEEARARAERAIARRISKNHTYIAENRTQTMCVHADGSADVILSSGDQSVTIALPKGHDFLVLGNEPAYDQMSLDFWRRNWDAARNVYPNGYYDASRAAQTGMFDGIFGGLGRWR